MQLLSKSEIDKKKGEERRSEIEQGIIIAKKVDKLRNLHAEEEKKFNLFYQETVGKYHKDISELHTQKESLKTEITGLQIIRGKLREPLDKEWENVKSKEKELDIGLEEVEKEHQVLLKEGDVLNTERSILRVAQAKVTENFQESKKDREEAQKLKVTAQEELATIEREHALFIKEYGDKIRYVDEKAKILENDIQHYRDFEQTLKMKAKELKDRERRLEFYERQYNVKPETRSK